MLLVCPISRTLGTLKTTCLSSRCLHEAKHLLVFKTELARLSFLKCFGTLVAFQRPDQNEKLNVIASILDTRNSVKLPSISGESQQINVKLALRRSVRHKNSIASASTFFNSIQDLLRLFTLAWDVLLNALFLLCTSWCIPVGGSNDSSLVISKFGATNSVMVNKQGLDRAAESCAFPLTVCFGLFYTPFYFFFIVLAPVWVTITLLESLSTSKIHFTIERMIPTNIIGIF